MEISFLTRVENISYDLYLKATVHNTFDSNVVNDVFIEEKVYMQYAHEFLDSEQINVDQELSKNTFVISRLIHIIN